MSDWICSECGEPKGEPSLAHPSLDDRYGVGFCWSCAPKPNPTDEKKFPRAGRPVLAKTVPLVHKTFWDADAFAERLRREADQKFIDSLLSKRNRNRDKTTAEIARRDEILGRWEREAQERRVTA